MNPKHGLNQPRFPIGRKIILASLGTLFFALFSMQGAFSWFYSKESREGFEQSLDTARATCLKVTELQSSRLKASMDSIRFSPRFRSAIEVGIHDMATLVDSTQTEYRLLKDAELMAIADGWGEPLIALQGSGEEPMDLTTPEKRSLQDHALIDVFATDEGWDRYSPELSENQIFEDFLLLRGELYRVLSTAVYDNFDNQIGIMLIGDQIDTHLVSELARVSGCEVSFMNGGRLKATSLPQQDHSNLQTAYAKGADTQVWEADPWLLMREPLQIGSRTAEVEMILKRSMQRFHANQSNIIKASLGLFVLLAMLSLGLNLLTTRSVVRPIRSLVSAFEKVGQGDLAVTVHIQSKDEVQTLGEAFNKMILDLRERANMSRFLTGMELQEVKDAAASNTEVIQGGQLETVSVLFSDIRSFTTLCENADPDLVVRSLNFYYNELVPIIEEYHGSLDKLIGDCIMAVFYDSEGRSSADNALDAALSMHARLNEIRPIMVRNGLLEFHNGYGINTGEAVVGNVGTREQFSKTVMGDTVNLAARVEGMSKEGRQTCILLTENTLHAMRHPKPVEFLSEVTVKGKSIPIRIHELCDTIQPS